MGSCHSVPLESTTASATSQVKKGVGEQSHKPNSVSVSRKTTNGSAHTPLSPAQSSSYTTTNQLSVPKDTTEHTSHGSAEDPALTPPREDDEKGGDTAAVMPCKKKKDFSLPSRKDSFKSQCSSTSSCSDSPERVNSGTLREWKNELAGGDLSTTVVRIETEFGRPIEEVYDGVHDGPILGSGVSGIVRKVIHRSTGVSYAVKCLDVGLLQGFNGYEHLKDEVFIMCKLDHPNIVRLEEVYESQSELYLIQELCLGGDLFDRLDDQPDIHYTEAQCARLVKHMLSSVRYLHSKNIIHRDLKLENFLFSSSKPDSELKMIDFGLSKHFFNGQVHNDPVGTPYTVAPEVLLGSYDERCDLWSMGVITYLLLCGETPFGGTDGESLSRVRENILSGQVSFEPSDVWENVSDAGKAFVKRLLERDSTKRPTAREAQHDPWITLYAKKNTKEGKCLSPHIASALVEFKEYSDMRKMLCEVLSFTLLPEQIVELRGEFEKMDHDGDGEISLSALKQVFMESAESGCLGALTEVEVEDIFNALRVRKSEPTIRWHEFIAASLSQCNFDERNLRLAFDRLDYDHKGFITFEDMKGLLGPGVEGDDAFHEMWDNGVMECHCPLECITYHDFLRVMKGQARDTDGNSRLSNRRLSTALEAVPEGCTSPNSNRMPRKSVAMLDMAMPQLPFLTSTHPGTDKHVDIGFPTDLPFAPLKPMRSRSLEAASEDWTLYRAPSPPPPLPASEAGLVIRSPLRRRSCFAATGFNGTPLSPRRASYAVRLAMDELNEAIKDDKKTPLVVNRALYRKHREMRQSVLLASKMFDEKRQERRFSELKLGGLKAGLVMRRESVARPLPTSSELRASTEHRRVSMPSSPSYAPHPLPSEEGEAVLSVPADVPASIMTQSEHEQMHRVEDASRRSGRPRRERIKTHSDMTQMMKGF